MGNIKTIIVQQDNQLNVDYQSSNLLRGNNEFAPGDVVALGADVDLVVGMVMGRVSATNKLLPLIFDASDGSQYPVGLAWMGLDATKTVVDGTTKSIEVVNKGKIDGSLINFTTTSTLDSVVAGRTVRDWLMDIGLVIIDPQEQTGFANA